FGINGEVATSTHAGLSWLRHLRRANGALHFWPFDGWRVAADRSVVAEVYPSIFRRRYPQSPTDSEHERDARNVCTWLRDVDQLGALPTYFQPALNSQHQHAAALEGWILGVM